MDNQNHDVHLTSDSVTGREDAKAQALRQQILAQIDRCAELAYAAGHHFAQHKKHAPSSIMTKADADATLIRLIEQYAACGASRGAYTPGELAELAALSDAAIAAAFRDVAARNYSTCYADLFRAHVIEKARSSGVKVAHPDEFTDLTPFHEEAARGVKEAGPQVNAPASTDASSPAVRKAEDKLTESGSCIAARTALKESDQ